MKNATCACALLLLMSCTSTPTDGVPERLGDWGLFEDAAQQVPAAGVIPYDVISPLYADYAVERRFMRLPVGGQIRILEDGSFELPEGTVLVMSFGYLADRRDPSSVERPIETRILELVDGEWSPSVYVWNEEGTEATYSAAGVRVDLDWIHGDGGPRTLRYRVPNVVQCANCHGGAGPVLPLGLRVSQLDFDGQLEALAAQGLFENAVPPEADVARLSDPFGPADLHDRARSYLEANCSHCHRPEGLAGQSGLMLHTSIPVYGICKVPVAAGHDAGMRPYDILPGQPDESVIVFRMESEEPGTRMPEIGTSMVHDEGVALIREWIAAMEGDCGP